jgi:YQGE family putative transporter
MLRLATLKGIAQGYIITAPVMLVMKLVGEEGTLGIIQSTGALLSAVLLYTLGRTTTVKHRISIFAAGLSLFVVGAVVNASLYSATGAIIFIACLVFARPLLDLAYFPLQLGVIEWVSAKEKRNQFAYIFSHELGIYIGRLFGCSLFILLARYAGEDVALRYALLVIALIQFVSIWVARSIMRDKAWEEPVADNQAALNKFKEPIEL